MFRPLSHGSAGPLSGSWFVSLTHRKETIPEDSETGASGSQNIRYAQVLFSRTALPTEGWSESHTKDNMRIIIVMYMHDLKLLRTVLNQSDTNYSC